MLYNSLQRLYIKIGGIVKTAIVQTSFWDEEEFALFHLGTRLVYNYLLTNPSRGLSPYIRLNKRVAGARTGLDSDQVSLGIEELVKMNWVAEYNGYIMLLKNHVEPKKGRFTNVALEKELKDIPEDVLEHFKIFGFDSKALPEHNIKDKDKNNNRNKKVDKVSKAYYDVIKEITLPIRNHTNLRSRIKQLEKDIGESAALDYLSFLKDTFPTIEDDGYKPVLLESLDVYAKRIQIESWIKRSQESKPKVVII